MLSPDTENKKYLDVSKENLGIEIDVFRAAFSETDHTLKLIYAPFRRIITLMNNNLIEAGETSGVDQPGLYYSKPIIACENVAISRSSAKISIKTIADLEKHSIVAWQEAKNDLGGSFLKMAKANKKYFENPNQRSQYLMFQKKRAEIIVIDRHIFHWWNKKLSKSHAKVPYTYHEIFPGVNEYRIGFRDKAIRDKFDVGLKKIRSSGEYDRIVKKYLAQGELISK